MKNTNSLVAGILVILVILAGGLWYAHRAPVLAPSSPNIPSENINPTSPVSFKVGQKISFGTFSLTLTKVAEDSRCPANVNCIWAGRVSAEFDAASGNTHQALVLATDTGVAYGGYDFKIDEVGPQKTSAAISPSDYVLTVSYISNN